MKTIAIFCDGTWNSPLIPERTHVHELCKATGDVNGQVCVYLPGVGTGNGAKGFFNKMLDKVGGGAFGWGLGRNVRTAYKKLAIAYEPGDRIMIFGFSRGAYTARAVAGMIRKAGLPTGPVVPDNVVNRAFGLYKKKEDEDHPDAPHIRSERRKISPDYATSDDDLAWRNDHSKLLEIAYIGVWDTVGAKGVPNSIVGPIWQGFANKWNQRYAFYDNALSSMVKSARHAVAADERRPIFEPSLWDNLDKVKDDPAKGLNRGDTSENRPFQQMFFVGNHSINGGSSASHKPISALTIQWVFEGAKGLELNPQIKFPDTDPDAMFDADGIDHVSGLYVRFGTRDREDTLSLCQCHPSVIRRMQGMSVYRPKSLKGFWP